MSTYIVAQRRAGHALRESECNSSGRSTIVSARPFGLRAMPVIRLTHTARDVVFGHELTVQEARALAAELIASADAIDTSLQVPA